MRNETTVLALALALAFAAPTPAAPQSPAAAVPAAPSPGVDDCGTHATLEDIRFMLAGEQAFRESGGAFLGGGTIYVPVAFHIVRPSNGVGGLGPHLVCTAMDVLDASYAPHGIQFFLNAPIDFIDDDDFYSNIDTPVEINALRSTNVVPDTLNIYCTDVILQGGNALCGISSFPNTSPQGVLIDNECMPPGNESTLPHEVGHYFNLIHTWSTSLGVELVDGSNCSSAGDVVCDTPADPGLSGSNMTGPPTCNYFGAQTDPNGDPYSPDTTNFMCAGFRACRDNFTAGQGARMVNAINIFRPELIHAAPPGSDDCNNNGMRDDCDIALGNAPDTNGDWTPDICQGTVTTFCSPAVANSSGGPAVMSATGSPNVGTNDLVLRADSLPPFVNGLMIQSDGTTNVPLGDGVLCLSSSFGFVLRLPFEASDGAGVMTHALDLGSPRHPFGIVNPGSTWYFQCWFRDPAAGMSGFNFSDGLAVLFGI